MEIVKKIFFMILCYGICFAAGFVITKGMMKIYDEID